MCETKFGPGDWVVKEDGEFLVVCRIESVLRDIHTGQMYYRKRDVDHFTDTLKHATLLKVNKMDESYILTSEFENELPHQYEKVYNEDTGQLNSDPDFDEYNTETDLFERQTGSDL